MTLRTIAIRASFAAFAAASSIALAAAPADSARPQVAPSVQSDDAGGSAPGAEAPKAKKFCVMQTITGSRMPKKTCRTAEEWKADGVDVSKTR